MAKKVVLTGIKPTGTPHLGNYVGAIQPALSYMNTTEDRSFLFFLADYHALTTVRDAERFRQLSHELAATWLACGLDPERVIFYRQSDIPEDFELSWILGCVCPKGLMNKSHAYKAAVQENIDNGVEERDAGINMGLYTYPVLMAADILLFDADLVPVGEDQIQHVEIARDLAGRFNREFGNGQDVLKLPQHVVKAEGASIPGLDGRKMSKSYDNVIPIFAPENQLRKLIMKIKTDSTPPEAPKDPDKSDLVVIYKQFATPEQTESLRQRLRAGGMGWGNVKQELFEVVNAHLAEKRAKYNELTADPARLERLLTEGAAKARVIAGATMRRVRAAVGR